MARLDCFFRGIYRSIRYKALISGHDLELHHKGTDVEVLMCKHCGKVEIGWW